MEYVSLQLIFFSFTLCIYHVCISDSIIDSYIWYDLHEALPFGEALFANIKSNFYAKNVRSNNSKYRIEGNFSILYLAFFSFFFLPRLQAVRFYKSRRSIPIVLCVFYVYIWHIRQIYTRYLYIYLIYICVLFWYIYEIYIYTWFSPAIPYCCVSVIQVCEARVSRHNRGRRAVIVGEVAWLIKWWE